MNLKLSLILLLTPFLSISQDFKLKDFNREKMIAEREKQNYESNVIYMYLYQKYDSISSKHSIKYLNYPDYGICSFKQEFEHQISFYLSSCKEAGGSSVRLILPSNMDMQNLKSWVEKIYNSAPFEGVPHQWNSTGNKFEPIDQGAGCYYEIKKLENTTLVTCHCGC